MLTLDSQVIGVFGYGKTGESVVRYLSEKKKSVVVFDTRPAPKNLMKIRDVEYNWQVLDWMRPDIDFLIVSPGLRFDLPILQQAKAEGVVLLSDIDLFFIEVNGKAVFGITGTNGKSTVTTMLAHVFSENGYVCYCGGNLGPPALDILSSDSDVYILELSRFQLERMQAYQFEVAAILNISEDHLDHHGSMINYVDSKHKIFDMAKKCVFNRDDKRTYPRSNSRITSFGNSPEIKEGDWSVLKDDSGTWATCNREKIVDLGRLPISGNHAELNLLCVLAMVCEHIEALDVVRALISYKGLDHRYKEVSSVRGIRFINDSKATNLGAVVSALDNFSEEKVILIGGGDGKGVDFEPLARAFVGKIKRLIAIGEDGPKIAAIAESQKIKTCFAGSIEEAVDLGYRAAEPGDTVLLSPACASFDMFENYEERGDRFEKAVLALSKIEA